MFTDRRTEAIAQAWNSTDLVATDCKRVALLVKEELDSLGDLGAVPGPERTLEVIAPERLPAFHDHRLKGLNLGDLLAG